MSGVSAFPEFAPVCRSVHTARGVICVEYSLSHVPFLQEFSILSKEDLDISTYDAPDQ